ncbi:MAG: SDR family NAD(P)-dependent oxidoreductase [Betaproteobacteria bacterium]|nr:SDR family NAD(P)-dependent oxidoreductase [Betaproteobacteria bacterium]
MSEKPAVVIVGVGNGLSASIARLFSREGMRPVLMARDVDKISHLCRETDARSHAGDCSNPRDVAALFESLDAERLVPEVVVFNASMRYRGPVASLDPDSVETAWKVGCYGGVLVAREAARRMEPRGRGSILFTGATASVKAFAESAPFAIAKFGLRALAQSMARELSPRGIHVAHVIIDGGIASTHAATEDERASDRFLDPDALARTYLELHRQHRSCWSAEVEVRPWLEKF